MARPPSRYVDPLDRIWLHAAARLDLRVRRDGAAYASTDGRGTLTIAPGDQLDPDDCLAQIILHELCHGLVQGEPSFSQADWGLANDEAHPGYSGDAVREHACLRLQAALLRPHGLRLLLAPTTDFRAYYDGLPDDPLAGPPGDLSVVLGREALGRSSCPPYARVLGEALEKTAAIHRLLADCPVPPAPEDPLPALWQVAPPPQRHPTGPPLADGLSGPVPATCGSCAWRFEAAGVSRCRRTRGEAKRGLRVDPAWPACVLHEAALELDCQACGACCRQAYDVVPLRRRDRVPREWVEPAGPQPEPERRMRRDPSGRRCAALSGPEAGPYTCVIYEDRPQTCRDFEAGSDSCLWARRRVGLSL